jgi:hypothetical protein
MLKKALMCYSRDKDFHSLFATNWSKLPSNVSLRTQLCKQQIMEVCTSSRPFWSDIPCPKTTVMFGYPPAPNSFVSQSSLQPIFKGLGTMLWAPSTPVMLRALSILKIWVSPQSHCQHCGLDGSLSGGGFCPVHFRLWNSIPCFYPLESRSTPLDHQKYL